MFERFTPAARQVVVRSEQEARELDHPVIVSGHLLLAIEAVGSDAAGRALTSMRFRRDAAVSALTRAVGDRMDTLTDDDADALRTIGIEMDEVRRAVESAFGDGALDRRDPRRAARRRPPFTSDAKKALELALREAIRLGDRHIGPAHLLLGMVRDASSSATTLLRMQGIEPRDLRSTVEMEIAAAANRSA